MANVLSGAARINLNLGRRGLEVVKMKTLFAFISRHTPTERQIELAAEQGIEVVHIGDLDAFTADVGAVMRRGPFEGVIVVHPAAAMRLAHCLYIGVYENASRAPEGGKPQFEAAALHVYDLRN